MVQNKLMSIIADEDSVTGFLLGGIGELNKNRESNFLVLIFLIIFHSFFIQISIDKFIVEGLLKKS